MRARPDASVGDASPSARGSGAAQHAARLAKLGLASDLDFALHLPLRYEDETHLTPLRDLTEGHAALTEATVIEARVQYRPRRQLAVAMQDGDRVLTARFFTFYPNQVQALEPGVRVRLYGEPRIGMFGVEMVHPRFRVLRDEAPLATSLTPVYPTVEGLPQAYLRACIERALKRVSIDEVLPQPLLDQLKLPALAWSIATLHHPPPDASLQALSERTHPAWQRVKFDELLAQQIAMRLARAKRHALRAPALSARDSLVKRFIAALPFALTRAQQQAVREIEADLARTQPMQRLLQGDVGSGKTVVAAIAALRAVENDMQVALMAPTEILAEQHFHKLAQRFEAVGVEVVWLTGSQKKTTRDKTLARIAFGEAPMVVGTHALFQHDVTFRRLALAIVDEQHRFGVEQRLALRLKGQREGEEPHQLMMSATPIPRTLAMTFYADLDVSTLRELPPGRTPIVTKLVSEERRGEVLARIREACAEGAQCYWVCPLVEASEKLELEAAKETFAKLSAELPELSVGLVHGRLKSAEKAAVMEGFTRNTIQLLVATTVIEVGVDVPNASLMVIEHAERMGLSQLHQLRGRVGRGAAKSTCILLYGRELSQTARERLKVIYESTDGFEIARRDLELRGPGELLGARQSGVPMLRFADLTRDTVLIEAARDAAHALLESDRARAIAHAKRWLGARDVLLSV